MKMNILHDICISQYELTPLQMIVEMIVNMILFKHLKLIPIWIGTTANDSGNDCKYDII